MGPRDGTDVLDKINISCPVPGIKPWIAKPAAVTILTAIAIISVEKVETGTTYINRDV
jgi:hypothetical protein